MKKRYFRFVLMNICGILGASLLGGELCRVNAAADDLEALPPSAVIYDQLLGDRDWVPDTFLGDAIPSQNPYAPEEIRGNYYIYKDILDRYDSFAIYEAGVAVYDHMEHQGKTVEDLEEDMPDVLEGIFQNSDEWTDFLKGVAQKNYSAVLSKALSQDYSSKTGATLNDEIADLQTLRAYYDAALNLSEADREARKDFCESVQNYAKGLAAVLGDTEDNGDNKDKLKELFKADYYAQCSSGDNTFLGETILPEALSQQKDSLIKTLTRIQAAANDDDEEALGAVCARYIGMLKDEESSVPINDLLDGLVSGARADITPVSYDNIQKYAASAISRSKASQKATSVVLAQKAQEKSATIDIQNAPGDAATDFADACEKIYEMQYLKRIKTYASQVYGDDQYEYETARNTADYETLENLARKALDDLELLKQLTLRLNEIGYNLASSGELEGTDFLTLIDGADTKAELERSYESMESALVDTVLSPISQSVLTVQNGQTLTISDSDSGCIARLTDSSTGESYDISQYEYRALAGISNQGGTVSFHNDSYNDPLYVPLLDTTGEIVCTGDGNVEIGYLVATGNASVSQEEDGHLVVYDDNLNISSLRVEQNAVVEYGNPVSMINDCNITGEGKIAFLDDLTINAGTLEFEKILELNKNLNLGSMDNGTVNLGRISMNNPDAVLHVSGNLNAYTSDSVYSEFIKGRLELEGNIKVYEEGKAWEIADTFKMDFCGEGEEKQYIEIPSASKSADSKHFYNYLTHVETAREGLKTETGYKIIKLEEELSLDGEDTTGYFEVDDWSEYDVTVTGDYKVRLEGVIPEGRTLNVTGDMTIGSLGKDTSANCTVRGEIRVADGNLNIEEGTLRIASKDEESGLTIGGNLNVKAGMLRIDSGIVSVGYDLNLGSIDEETHTKTMGKIYMNSSEDALLHVGRDLNVYTSDAGYSEFLKGTLELEGDLKVDEQKTAWETAATFYMDFCGYEKQTIVIPSANKSAEPAHFYNYLSDIKISETGLKTETGYKIIKLEADLELDGEDNTGYFEVDDWDEYDVTVNGDYKVRLEGVVPEGSTLNVTGDMTISNLGNVMPASRTVNGKLAVGGNLDVKEGTLRINSGSVEVAENLNLGSYEEDTQTNTIGKISMDSSDAASLYVTGTLNAYTADTGFSEFMLGTLKLEGDLKVYDEGTAWETADTFHMVFDGQNKQLIEIPSASRLVEPDHFYNYLTNIDISGTGLKTETGYKIIKLEDDLSLNGEDTTGYFEVDDWNGHNVTVTGDYKVRLEGVVPAESTLTVEDGSMTISSLGKSTPASSTIKGSLIVGGDLKVEDAVVSVESEDEKLTIGGDLNVEDGTITIDSTDAELAVSRDLNVEKGTISIDTTGEELTIGGNLNAKEGTVSIDDASVQVTGNLNLGSYEEEAQTKTMGKISMDSSDSAVLHVGGNMNAYTSDTVYSEFIKGALELEGNIKVYEEGKAWEIADTFQMVFGGNDKQVIDIPNASKSADSKHFYNYLTNVETASAGLKTETGYKIIKLEDNLSLNGEDTAGYFEVDNWNGNNVSVDGNYTVRLEGVVPAESTLTVEDGSMTISSLGKSTPASSTIKGSLIVGGDLKVEDAVVSVESEDEKLTIGGDLNVEDGTITIDSAGEGLAVSGDLNVEKGTINIDKTGEELTIGGDLNVKEGTVSIDDASVQVTENLNLGSYEEEAQTKTMGKISMDSSDSAVLHVGGNMNAYTSDTGYSEFIKGTLELEGDLKVQEEGNAWRTSDTFHMIFAGEERQNIEIPSVSENDGYINYLGSVSITGAGLSTGNRSVLHILKLESGYESYGDCSAISFADIQENTVSILEVSKMPVISVPAGYGVSVSESGTADGKYDISVESASETFSVSYYVDDTLEATQTNYIEGSVIIPYQPILTGGNKLDGWYADEACTMPYDFAETVDEDIKLYAKTSRIPLELILDSTELTFGEVGENKQIKASLNVENTELPEITWSSSDEAVATVSQQGLVTAVGAGTAVITAATAQVESVPAECNVVVNRKDIETIDVQALSDQVYTGEPIEVEPEFESVNHTLRKGVDYEIEYPADHTELGPVSVTIKGIGNYTGERVLGFRIIQRTSKVTPVASKTQLYLGDAFPDITLATGDTEGSIAFDDGQELEVGKTGYTWTFTPADEHDTVVIGELLLTVLEVKLTEIEISSMPSKTMYRTGELFDPAGLEIQAVYNNGKKETVTGFTTDHTDPDETPLALEDKKVIVTYIADGEVVTCSVPIQVFEELAADTSVYSVKVNDTYGIVDEALITVVLPADETLPADASQITINTHEYAAVEGMAQLEGGQWQFAVRAQNNTDVRQYTLRIEIAANEQKYLEAQAGVLGSELLKIDYAAIAEEILAAGGVTEPAAGALDEETLRQHILDEFAGNPVITGNSYSVSGNDIVISDIKETVDGDADNPDGEDGGFALKIRTADGSVSTEDIVVTFPAQKYTGTSNLAVLEEIERAIATMPITLSQEGANSSDEQAIRDSICRQINQKLVEQEYDVEITAQDISIVSITPAVSGTVAKPEGENGSVTFTVRLSKEKTSLTTESVTSAIVPLPAVIYTITISTGVNGAITDSTEKQLLKNDNWGMRFATIEGYYIADVRIDGQSIGAVTSYTFTNIDSDHSIQLSYVKVADENPSEGSQNADETGGNGDGTGSGGTGGGSGSAGSESSGGTSGGSTGSGSAGSESSGGTSGGSAGGGNAEPASVKVTKITLVGDSAKIAAGKKLTLKADIAPADATNKNLTWKSSNTKYAKVSDKGVVATQKAGAGKTVTITATAKDGSGKSATYKITIMKKPVSKIKLKASKISVKAGKSVKIKATVTPSSKKTTNTTLAWKSSNTKYAKVSNKGVVTTQKAGAGKKVTITATATDGSKKKAKITIKITK